MGKLCFRSSLIVLLVLITLLVISVSLAGGSGGVAALVLDNNGKLAEGSLTGISPVIRLNVPRSVSPFGPPQAFDISLSTVRQITLDFPRLIVETSERVYLGPFSAFSGVSELLSLRKGNETLGFPTTSLRAIALHGNPLGPVPRQWLGDEFLTLPEVITAQALKAEGGETLLEEPSERIYWEELYPTLPPEPTQESQWWLNALIFAGLAALVYFSLISNGG